ncbi:uncharacterized protein BDZ99DRAFT_501636, partial [Mytilinidion resinicola]
MANELAPPDDPPDDGALSPYPALRSSVLLQSPELPMIPSASPASVSPSASQTSISFSETVASFGAWPCCSTNWQLEDFLSMFGEFATQRRREMPPATCLRTLRAL